MITNFLIPPIQSLPFPASGNIQGNPNYDSRPAVYAHSSMPDADGNLRFFIIDGRVYDKDGLLKNKDQVQKLGSN
jgi:hypothetical protein